MHECEGVEGDFSFPSGYASQGLHLSRELLFQTSHTTDSLSVLRSTARLWTHDLLQSCNPLKVVLFFLLVRKKVFSENLLNIFDPNFLHVKKVFQKAVKYGCQFWCQLSERQWRPALLSRTT